MGAEPLPDLPGFRRLALGDVDSTNSVALELARKGEPGGLWITARRQLKGRGRRGRPWVSEEGNLYASLLLTDPAPPERIGTLPLVAALAVYRTLRPFFAATPQALAIKWPNDVLVDGQKVNGVLLESERLSKGRLAVVIGCGINCAHHPADTPYPATDLAACGVAVAPDALFAGLAAAFDRTLAEWNGGLGFEAIRTAWLLAARGVGERVVVSLQDRSLDGRFEDIDREGYLCLRTDDGALRLISAGDLFFGQEGHG
ncbi:MAG: biotin--[acetyl-CoA-carboxylase] ligase [Mesorhizobium sp.]